MYQYNIMVPRLINLKYILVTYMKKSLIVALLCSGLFLSSCAQTTSSMFGDDRSQLLLVSESELNSEAKSSYDKVIAQARAQGILNTDEYNSARVSMISKRLIEVAPTLRSDCGSWQWEVNTISDPTVNAWCMPGGKIVVYTGLIKTLDLNDDELASIIGHEISHALKEHSREKMSQAMVQDGLTSLASLLGVKKLATDTANLAFNTAFAMPFSRDQESEADKYGLELAYKAGFDPNAAVTVMKKMDRFEKEANAKEGNQSKAESFLNSIASTHPASETRYRDLQELIDRHHLSK